MEPFTWPPLATEAEVTRWMTARMGGRAGGYTISFRGHWWFDSQ